MEPFEPDSFGFRRCRHCTYWEYYSTTRKEKS